MSEKAKERLMERLSNFSFVTQHGDLVPISLDDAFDLAEMIAEYVEAASREFAAQTQPERTTE